MDVFAQTGADSMLNFIIQNKSRTSLYLQKNDTVKAALNENKSMPLASTVKILVAIEFAKQAAANFVNENKYVALTELANYYLPGTDDDGHADWINYEKQMGDVFDDSVKLIDVARGMIMFSSNANTEFLMDLLGFKKVNNNIDLFGLKKHSPIYPMVSSLFMYQNPKDFKEDKILKDINKLSEVEYARSTMLIHEQMKEDSDYKNTFRPEGLTYKMQKLWSDRLPSSTTKDYVRIGNVLNDRKNFNQNTFGILAEVLETMMENPANQSLFLHAGMKGGSTIFVLTKDLYATLKNGTRIELAYFFNDLSQVENLLLQSWTNDFELKVLTDESFRKRMKF